MRIKSESGQTDKEMRIIKINPAHPEDHKIKEGIRVLENAGLVAFPTDTVYGLGADAESLEAIDRLYQVKKRPREKPLILFLAKKEEILDFTETIPLSAQRLMNKFWPGPLTLIFKASSISPATLLNQQGEIAIRVPSHPIPQKLIEKNKILLGTTSANLSGEPSPLRANQISAYLKEGIDLLLDGGETLLGEESTIVRATSSELQLIREGWLPRETVDKEGKAKGDILFVCTGNTCRSVMAEALLKKLWPEEESDRVKIHSAGIAAFHGSLPGKMTLEVLREKGINASSYRSARSEGAALKTADLILVMEKDHRERILHLYPPTRGKVFLLKEFATGSKEEISDPMGGSYQSYEECLREIEENIKGIIKKLGLGYDRGA